MGRIISHGYQKSISIGQCSSLTNGYPIPGVKTVFETRRTRLRMLIDQYGSIAALNQAIGWETTNARLSQIQNRSIRSDRGTAYEMGDVTARLIEEKLTLHEGWMDTPPDYSELYPDNRIAHVMKVMEAMPEWQRDQAMKIVDTIAEPAKKNGTTE